MYNIINVIDIYLNSIKIEIACTTDDEMLLVKDSRERERERETERKKRERDKEKKERRTHPLLLVCGS